MNNVDASQHMCSKAWRTLYNCVEGSDGTFFDMLRGHYCLAMGATLSSNGMGGKEAVGSDGGWGRKPWEAKGEGEDNAKEAMGANWKT